MNGSSKQSLFGRENYFHHRRGIVLSGISKDTDENMDLFSRNRRILSDGTTHHPPFFSAKLGSAKHAGNGLDDLLSSNNCGPHDYDWLHSPPGTPLLVPSSDGSDYSQPASVAPRSSSLARTVSTTKALKISVSESKSNHPSRPTRSSSLTRPSISTTHYSTYTSNKSSASILNTSSSSVSSYIRPSTPTTRSSSSTARPSSPSVRSKTSLASTPSKSRLTLPHSGPSSTPSCRPQKIHSNLNSSATRSVSRPSTPTRRNPPPSLSPVGPSTSTTRVLSNGRNSAPLARPSSPGPRVRTPPQPIVLPDFSLDTPPNLRTTLPAERPLSASRSRPGAVVTLRGNAETPRWQSSLPTVTRRRLVEPTGRAHIHVNGQVDKLESCKASHVSESSMQKPLKISSEITGFGRSISKKSLDMAIQHMDIRNGSPCSLTGSTVFPQSIRLVNNKSQAGRASIAPRSVDGKPAATKNGFISENGNYINRSPENGSVEDKDPLQSAKVTKVEIYESTCYDPILMKEDFKNTTWLHSADV